MYLWWSVSCCSLSGASVKPFSQSGMGKGAMAASVYISDKAVVDLVPYAARRTAFRLDVGPFVLLYLGVYLGIWNLDPKDGWGQMVVLVLLPGVLACHLLVFLSTQWSIRFMCLVSQRRVASIDLAEVRYVRNLDFAFRWVRGVDCGRSEA